MSCSRGDRATRDDSPTFGGAACPEKAIITSPRRNSAADISISWPSSKTDARLSTLDEKQQSAVLYKFDDASSRPVGPTCQPEWFPEVV